MVYLYKARIQVTLEPRNKINRLRIAYIYLQEVFFDLNDLLIYLLDCQRACLVNFEENTPYWGYSDMWSDILSACVSDKDKVPELVLQTNIEWILYSNKFAIPHLALSFVPKTPRKRKATVVVPYGKINVSFFKKKHEVDRLFPLGQFKKK
ncbi:hypothetical protein PHYBLDRAFT_170867 [Phycomyces blakesleeanus NRRL 1555(-)]|uniref:Uncharacterized protein n=1 Tax=Phycomyces blakesleeanus (strain ATCC 8743b / DSM 1359 / FGSC 10004 / NBRC 33097 / NRRL 1555) TaxID=763407 RepID=A0A163DEV3_PHYB8|nr:hypothetical protein PHYBLDRAFT_170867 [Phycomyces blakesleeanus NRRL 1555(-)]OAD70780.1 hypothetical protein PHYBLDRAFT_170867 [Phycomyces blakesleeanus NRRL 1555(-)]|eukprot:XP_018288820.1 hypothetical protein PHYBLDRAFT_170867 [Phycomyces blakesleeanus NRRL 1555(-)]